jgi:hypothetical protein
MRFTEREYRDYEARRMSRHPNWTTRILNNPIACEQESELQQQIATHCQIKEWYCERSAMHKPTTNGTGSLDFKIAMPNGKMLWLETKRRGSKTTPAQNNVIAHLRKLGHWAEVVWSFEEFLKLVNQTTQPPK